MLAQANEIKSVYNLSICRRYNEMSQSSLESYELLLYQVQTLGHCCRHGRAMTRWKRALRGCQQQALCLKAYSYLGKSLSISKDRELFDYLTVPILWDHWVENVVKKRTRKYGVHLTDSLQQILLKHREYHSCKPSHISQVQAKLNCISWEFITHAYKLKNYLYRVPASSSGQPSLVSHRAGPGSVPRCCKW